jgi:hypothetical protein
MKTAEQIKEATDAMKLYAEIEAKAFAEWTNQWYVTVVSYELNKKEWVKRSIGIRIHATDFYYTDLIKKHGETIDQLYTEYEKQKNK